MNLFKRNQSKKENVGHRLQYEIIEYERRKYKDPLIAGAYHDYFGNYSRKEVCLNDAIGERLTMGYMKTILMKYPKFTANDEVQTQYIMDDIREAIQAINLKDALIDIGTNCIISGWSLVLWDLIEEALKVKIFGWDECHPRFWTRFSQPTKENMIYKYKAYFIPYPQGREAAYFSMKQERYIMFPNQPNFQHLTRGTWNYGLGYARIQPIWDAITKLRERSDSEHFRSSNFMEARYPKPYTHDGRAKDFIDKVRKTDRTTGIAIEEYTNPKTGEPTGLPSVKYRPWSEGSQGSPFDTNKASAFMDNEWARLLCNLGYSQVWAVGTQAGQQEGSEINLTRDDRADIAEFSLIAPIFKKVLKKLAELGIFTLLECSQESINLLLTEQYQIVCWKTWEYNDKIELQQQQMLMQHQMEQERGTDDQRNDYDQERENVTFDTKKPGRWITKGGKHIYIPFKERELILFGEEEEGIPQYVTSLYSHPKEETLYAEFRYKGGERESIELATHVDEMIKIKKWLEHRIEKILGTPEEVKKYEEEYLQMRTASKILNKMIRNYRTNEKVHHEILNALRKNIDFPMTPVMSSWVEQAGVYKGHLLVKYHDEADIFGYSYPRGEDEAFGQYLDMMESGSKGGWIWDNILMRPSVFGMEQGKLFEKGSKIKHREPPGRPATFKYQPVPSFGAAAGTAAEMREFKMEGEKETATEGLGTTTKPFTWKTPKIPEAPEVPSYFEMEKEPKYPSPEVYGVPFQYYSSPTKIRTSALPPLFKLSRKKFNEAALKLGVDTFGSRSIDKVKELIEKAEKFRKNNQIRYNSISIGNPMSFGIPLYYDIDGKISEEYPCPEAWQKIENHKGNLWLYEDLGHGGDRITVGTYEYYGWDEELDSPIVVFDYDENLIRQKINNIDSEIIKRLDAGLEPEMSTEYYCKTVNREGKTFQVNFRDAEGRPRFDGIAIVEFGNCPTGHCNFERINSKTRSEWIACCMKKHGPSGDGTMTKKQCIAAAYKKFGGSK